MLIALVMAFFLGGGDAVDLFPKQTQKRVATVVADEARADAVIAQMDYAETRAAQFVKRTGKRLDDWLKVDRDHDATSQELDRALAGILDDRKTTQDAFLDALFAMKDQLGRDEWTAIFDPPTSD